MSKVGKILGFTATVVTAFCVMFVTYIAIARTQPTVAPAQPQEHIYTPAELLDQANKLRAEKGVAPLKLDERLNQSAQWKADDMKSSGVYEHVRDGYPGVQKIYDLTTAMDKKSECQWAAENLTGATRLESPIRKWKNSPKHYETEVNPRYDTTGFGVVTDENNQLVYVQHFCDLK